MALVGEDEATVKRFYREPGGKIGLHPANSQMSPILVAATDVKIQGGWWACFGNINFAVVIIR